MYALTRPWKYCRMKALLTTEVQAAAPVAAMSADAKAAVAAQQQRAAEMQA
eukprot:SAG25_NODE_577_length_6782_cov_26.651504_4_plen_51_part_00